MPAILDRCVKEVLSNPNFKAKQKGQSRESAAYAVCNSRIKKCLDDYEKCTAMLKAIKKG